MAHTYSMPQKSKRARLAEAQCASGTQFFDAGFTDTIDEYITVFFHVTVHHVIFVTYIFANFQRAISPSKSIQIS